MTYSRGKIFVTVSAILVAAVTALGFMWYPHLADDLNSAVCFKSTYLHGAPIDMRAYWDNLSTILYHNHFRLPNLLMPFVILLPEWLVAGASGAVLVVMMLIAASLGGFRERPLVFALFVLGMAVVYPWFDQLYLTSFQLPYIYGPTLSVWMLWLLVRGRGSVTGMAVLGCVIGLWHEIWGVTLLLTCAVGWIRYRDMRTCVLAAAIISLAISLGVLTVLFTFNVERAELAAFGLRSVSILPFMLPMSAAVIIGLIRWRRCDRTQFMLLVATCISLLACMYFLLAPRITALGNLCALTFLCSIIPVRGIATRHSVLATVIMAVVCAHYMAVDAVCLRTRRDFRGIVDAYEANPDSVVFSHIDFPEDQPWYLLFKPAYSGWSAYKYCAATINSIYSDGVRPIEYLPVEMAGFTPAGAQQIGDSIYAYRGHIVGTPSTPEWLVTDYGMGPRLRLYIYTDFVGDDGRRWRWMHPGQIWLDYRNWHHPLSAVAASRPEGFRY